MALRDKIVNNAQPHLQPGDAHPTDECDDRNRGEEFPGVQRREYQSRHREDAQHEPRVGISAASAGRSMPGMVRRDSLAYRFPRTVPMAHGKI